MDLVTLKELNEYRRKRIAAIVVTNLSDGKDRIVAEGDAVPGELGDPVASAFRSGNSVAVEAEGSSYFLNVHLPAVRFYIVGATHISQALGPMAKLAGLDTTVIDPRTAFATEERFKEVRLSTDWPQDFFKHNPLDHWCGLAAVTHDPKIDDPALIPALEAGCFYVGALGSRKTHVKRLERLGSAGLTDEQLQLIEAPIGLNIGASTPAEIAVAILGSVISAIRSRGAMA